MTKTITKASPAKFSLKQRVKVVIDQIRPAVQGDGGDVELVDVQSGVVLLRLTGACATCPMSSITLKLGIEQQLKQKVKGVKEVVQVD
ncbi:MAG: NifU family protein [Patescibacteria group bacterium]|jgi:Fe-S cluster biogenesis protein NfuA